MSAGPRELLARSLRPPLRDRRFWLIQALVILIAAVHWGLTLGGTRVFGLPAFEPVALFFIPVVYAALNFGLAGSLATATWVALLSLPSLALGSSRIEDFGIVTLVILLGCVAGFVGQRVEREVLARQEAVAARTALFASEARLRSLFENSPAPILLVDPGGTVRAANQAASTLFARPRSALVGTPLAELVGEAAAAEMSAGSSGVIELGGERHLYLRPVISSQPDGSFQAVFLDVSEERRRLGIKDAYAARVLRAQEEERARIAQELHDEPLQSVVHLYRLLDGLAGEASDGTARRLAEARGVAERIAEELRRLARGLRPASLEDLGLVAALQRLVRDLDGRGLEAYLEVAGAARRLDPLVELGLFRIAQEGLRNVERHAQAHCAHVKLNFEPDAVTLTVEDDGIGLPERFLYPTPEEPHSLGLVGMHERASLLGGRLQIQSRPGRGTRLQAVIPT